MLVMGARDEKADWKIGRQADRAFGLVRRDRLLAARVTKAEIEHRLRSGALRREYPGIYRVGHRAPSVEASYLAAVWACGEGALLSGRAAAYLWGLIKGKPPPAEVIAPKWHAIDGIKTSQRKLTPADGTSQRGIPITSVARTLVDLAAELTEEELARACHEAGVKHQTTPRDVKKVLQRLPNARGAAKLRAVLDGKVPVSLSALERRFNKLLREAGLPLPITNKPKGSYRIDCRWPNHPLTVELDSYRYHNSRHAWEQDRERERQARQRGDEFRRYTWQDVFEQPAPMLDDLSRLLG
jgi:predicted transcriptional regulator of viral defense system